MARTRRDALSATTVPPKSYQEESMSSKWGLSKILLVAAVVVFVLAALGMAVGDLNLIAVGLALGFASYLV